MTTEQFDNYDFSIYTEIKTKGDTRWERIKSVDFVNRWIETDYHGYPKLEDIEEIRN